MKRTISPFLAGAAAAMLAVALCGTALAVSGTIRYNTANIALGAEKKIAAESDITAPNGQRVPASILYTDGAGGKTNYLPIRTICDLLGVEITYDSTARTIHLGGTAREGWHWMRGWDGQQLHYQYEPPEGQDLPGDEPPLWRPTWLGEGWRLSGVNAASWGNGNCDWRYQKGAETLTFSCCALRSTKVGNSLYTDAATAYRPALVHGKEADFYQDGERGLLVWEAADGMLCKLEGPLDQSALTQIAESVQQATAEPLPTYQLGDLPEGSTVYNRSTLREVTQESWLAADGTINSWLYTTQPAKSLIQPAGAPETVLVKGIAAKYWPPEDGANASGGVTITTGETTHILAGAGQKSTLLWTDAETGITFRIQGVLEKETILRIGEGITGK